MIILSLFNYLASLSQIAIKKTLKLKELYTEFIILDLRKNIFRSVKNLSSIDV